MYLFRGLGRLKHIRSANLVGTVKKSATITSMESSNMLCDQHFESSDEYDNTGQDLEKIYNPPDIEVESAAVVGMNNKLDEATVSRKEKRLEICVDSLESALNAIHGGADELEICSSLAEGGLTPTLGLVQQIISAVGNISTGSVLHKSCSQECSCLKLKKIPQLNIMLRCRPGSDFTYTNLEMDTMISDLNIFKTALINRFVFGAILNKSIDIDNCTKIISSSEDIPVTFHRAFDVCENPLEALVVIKELGFKRILTSGQQNTAVDDNAVSLISKLIEQSGDLEIMPGAGINSENVKPLIEVGCKIFHGSCKRKKQLPKGLAMGSTDNDWIWVTDENEVRNMKKAIINKE